MNDNTHDLLDKSFNCDSVTILRKQLFIGDESDSDTLFELDQESQECTKTDSSKDSEDVLLKDLFKPHRNKYDESDKILKDNKNDLLDKSFKRDGGTISKKQLYTGNDSDSDTSLELDQETQNVTKKNATKDSKLAAFKGLHEPKENRAKMVRQATLQLVKEYPYVSKSSNQTYELTFSEHDDFEDIMEKKIIIKIVNRNFHS